jgi:hypothetical protein
MSESSESKFIACLVPPAVRAELERSAAEHERSLSGEIRLALRRHLEVPDGRRSRPEATVERPGDLPESTRPAGSPGPLAGPEGEA